MSGKLKKLPSLTKEGLSRVLIQTRGNIKNTAQSFQVARNTIYKKIHEWDLEEVVNEAREVRIDMVESALDDAIQEGNVTAIIFFLKTQGRSRGYVERQDVNFSGEIQVPQIKWGEDSSDDE